MTFLKRILFFIFLILFASCKKEEDGVLSSVITNTPIASDYFKVILHGKIINVGSGIINQGFEWGHSPSLMEGSDKVAVIAGVANSSGDFQVEIGDLNPFYTTTYCRAFATTIAGTTRGDIVSFTVYQPFQPLANMPFSERAEGVSFVIGDKGYCVFGRFFSTWLYEVWEFDSNTGIWTRKADCPQSLISAVAFSIGGKGYVATGAPPGGGKSNALLEYDPATDTWATKANCPKALYTAAGFVINDKAYITTGQDNLSGYNNNCYEYDPATNVWTMKASYPGVWVNKAVGFSIAGKGYLGLGDALVGSGSADELWEYDPLTNVWVEKAGYPGGSEVDQGVAMVINGKAYVGSGTWTNKMYKFDPIANSWKRITDHVSIGGKFEMTFAGKSYVGAGASPGRFYNSFYEFVPIN